jgi:hypothetical protein
MGGDSGPPYQETVRPPCRMFATGIGALGRHPVAPAHRVAVVGEVKLDVPPDLHRWP